MFVFFFPQIMHYFRQPPTLTLRQPFQCLNSLDDAFVFFCVVRISFVVAAAPTDWLTRSVLGISPLSTRNL